MLNQKQLAIIKAAGRLHGHVGPFLVVGLKMGNAAKKALNIAETEQTRLSAQVAIPLNPPFSCLLDGIQVSTTCTVGNQRLQFRNAKNIKAIFKAESGETVTVTLAKSFWEQLEQQRKLDKLDETFAWELAELSDSQLFCIALE